MPSPLSPLRRSSIRDILDTNLSTGYMTFTGIVQSAALYVLASTTADLLSGDSASSDIVTRLQEVLPYSLFYLLVIVLVLYCYTWFGTIWESNPSSGVSLAREWHLLPRSRPSPYSPLNGGPRL